MIDIGVCQKNACDRTVTRRVAARLQLWRVFDLSRKIGRSVDEKPSLSVASDRDARLCLRCNFSAARSDAVRARTVPLRQATARRAPENTDTNQLIPLDHTAPA